jgi:hypothetical protein
MGGRDPLFQNGINLRALSVLSLPVGDNVLVHNDNVVITPYDVSHIDLGISAGMHCLAIHCVEPEFPTVLVPVGKISNIMRTDSSCGSVAVAVNMVGQDDVPWCGVGISIQCLGWLIWIKQEV